MSQTESTSLLCPVCRVDLVMSERQNIEIDYCPKCRGVWLDRGELDKIIERNVAEAQPISKPAPQPSSLPPASPNAPWGGAGQAPGYQSGHGYDQTGYGGHGSHGGHGSRGGHGRGFLGRLFD